MTAAKAQWSPAPSRIRVKLRNPTIAKFGCSRCVLQFTSASGGSVLLTGVAHWTWSNNFLYFFPEKGVTPDTFNKAFNIGDTITVSKRDSGRSLEKNLALSLVYGINSKDRIRVGSAGVARDFSVFTVNALGKRINPGGTLSTRQYFATGDYMGMHDRVTPFIKQAVTRLDAPDQKTGDNVLLFAADGSSEFGVAIKKSECDATTQCIGSTKPKSGLVPLFAIQCGP